MENKESSEMPVKKSWKENINTFIAVTTLILAVCATLTAFKAAGYGNKMVLAQSQASDQWAYYQAKSIKETTIQAQRDMVELTMEQTGITERYKEKIIQYDKEIARYKQEKNDITVEAKRLEGIRDASQGYNSNFGQALIFLQIGILLSSLASINKVTFYWYMGLAAGGTGVIMFIYTMATIV
ncbi:DUF4337 domain-containing protein [Pelosinus sp. sgz500959]|uniref:DUF4337 domain-containing protein n=1 Tax=Pelosinus sp. sgz500959 TaxID=3242472 RepID=UPI0036726CA2